MVTTSQCRVDVVTSLASICRREASFRRRHAQIRNAASHPCWRHCRPWRLACKSVKIYTSKHSCYSSFTFWIYCLVQVVLFKFLGPLKIFDELAFSVTSCVSVRLCVVKYVNFSLNGRKWVSSQFHNVGQAVLVFCSPFSCVQSFLSFQFLELISSVKLQTPN